MQHVAIELKRFAISMVGDAIMGAPVDLEHWAEQELGSLIGGAIVDGLESHFFAAKPSVQAHPDQPAQHERIHQHFQVGIHAANGMEDFGDYLYNVLMTPDGGHSDVGYGAWLMAHHMPEADRTSHFYHASVVTNSTKAPAKHLFINHARAETINYLKNSGKDTYAYAMGMLAGAEGIRRGLRYFLMHPLLATENMLYAMNLVISHPIDDYHAIKRSVIKFYNEGALQKSYDMGRFTLSIPFGR